jgi:hypothetical protein
VRCLPLVQGQGRGVVRAVDRDRADELVGMAFAGFESAITDIGRR